MSCILYMTGLPKFQLQNGVEREQSIFRWVPQKQTLRQYFRQFQKVSVEEWGKKTRKIKKAKLAH